MTSKRTVLGWLAALALVAAACGGGGDAGSGPLAAADVPIVPEVAGDAPPPEEGEIVEEEEVPDGEVPEGEAVIEGEEPAEGEAPESEASTPDAEPGEEPYAYADDAQRAATMVVLPEDVAGAYPDIRLDAAHTGPVPLFADYQRGIASAGFGDVNRRPRAVYESFMLTGPDTEARRRAGNAHPEVMALVTRVWLYGDQATAALRLAEMRTALADVADVADQPGVAGDGFVAVFEDQVLVGMAGHGTVGTVMAVGADDPAAALEAAGVLGVRMWKVSAGTLPPRDPGAAATGHRLPTQVLDTFAASGDVVISDGGDVVGRFRWSGKYAGPERFSCQLSVYDGVSETLAADVVAADGKAAVFDVATMSSGQYDLYSPEVADAVWLCPVLPDAWRGTFVLDSNAVTVEPASTSAGPGTALRARSQWRMERGFGAEFVDGQEAIDFSVFVGEDGWVTAMHAEASYPREFAEEFYGGDFGSVERVVVRESIRVTEVDGVEVPEPVYFTADGLFAVGVGEEVMPPAAEPAPAADGGDGAAPAGDGSDGGDAGGGSGGDVAAASQDDGLFGSGSYGTGGSGEGHFAGTTPVGGAQDAATQDAISNTMLGLVAFYVDNGNYLATPADVAFYVGVVTTDDPSQAGSAPTVFVPGDQETVVWAEGGSEFFCMASSANEVIVFGSGSNAGEVDTFDDCVARGSTDGW